MKTMKKIVALFFALVLALTAAQALADTVRPLPVSTDPALLDGRRLLTDITANGRGGVRLTLFETELFSGDGIRGLKAGDTLVTEGVEYPVFSVREDEYGLILINEGDNDRQLTLAPDFAGRYSVIAENDESPYLTVGVLETEIPSCALLLDGIDPQTGEALEHPVMHTAEEFLQMLAADPVGFSVKNTSVLYVANEPRLIERFYAPWQ